MTNFLHALAVLEAARRPGEIRIHPHDAVEALAKAGLIMPDLPEPRTFPDTYEWHMKDGYVSLEDGILHVIHDETDEDWEPAELEPDPGELCFSDTTKARETAHAILAACDLKDAHDE